MLAEWFALTPMLLLGLAIIVLPGALVLRVSGFRGSLTVSAAAPISLGILAASGLVAGALKVPWSLWILAAGTALTVLSAWLVARLILGRLPSLTTAEILGRPKYASTITFTAVAVAVLASAWAVVSARGPDYPVQQIDATFHQSLPWIITQTGDASMLTGPSHAMGLRAIPTYYPLVWHVLVATIGGPTHIIEATHVMILLLPVIWLLGIGGLALEAFPRSRWAAAAAVSAAMLFPAYPAFMQVRLPVWPNALGIAVIPAIVALLLRSLRLLETLTKVGRRRALVAFLGFLLAYLGAVATYPVTLFATLFLIIPLIGGIFFQVRNAILAKYGRHAAASYLVATVLAVAGVLVLLAVWNPRLVNVLFRDSFASFDGIVGKLKAMVTMWPLGTGWPFIYVAYLVIAAIIAGGLWTTFSRREQHWLGWAWVIAFTVLAAAYFPLGPLTNLTGLWYNSPYRLIPLLILPTSLMAASIWQRLETKLLRSRQWPDRRVPIAVGAALTVLLAVTGQGLTYTARSGLMQPEYENREDVPVYLADPSEIEMLQRLRGELDPDLMVLGDPANGSTLVEPISNHRTVFPHLTYRTLDTDALYLTKNFRFIETDDRVCRILRHYGIGYYYQDEPGRVTGIDPQDRSPGLYNVDTSTGFELVDQADTAKVYKITACGEINRTSTWWVLDRNFEPLFDKYGNRNQFDKDGKLILPGQKP